MIRLQKTVKPSILVSHAANWTKALTDKLARNEKPTKAEASRYRHEDIKLALIEETKGKCAYCESKLLNIEYGDIEYIYPKSLDPLKTFEWDNLTLACDICNGNKSNKDPYIESILDPYIANPDEYLIFIGHYLFSAGKPAGISTITILELNRVALIERRKEHIDRIMLIYDVLLREDIPLITKQGIYKNLKEQDGGEAGPYSGMIRALIEGMRSKIPPELEL